MDTQHQTPTPAIAELAADHASRKRFLRMVGGAGATRSWS
ncbi:MAG: hypothetical protein JWO02_4738 [Solirubrobacterales bacterium]|nr:hypothetical protein [Solirubrobacterales bacterium]